MSLSTCTRILRLGLGWSVGQIKGRPFNVQAKGQLWPTRAFYAECAQVRAGRQSRNADFISIAAKRRYHHPLNPVNSLNPLKPVNLLNLFLHNPSTQPAAPAASLFFICGVSRHSNPRGQRLRQTYEPLGRRPIHLKNPYPSLYPFLSS